MTLYSIEFSSRAKIVLRRVWHGIREWCGDAAYERYAKSHAKHSGCAVLLSREEFYLQQLHKRYSNVSRCC
jgi:uncharacterized short protein YbdD (DUF466 family)